MSDYQHIKCHVCGWSGWTDSGVCEGCPTPETCDDCGEEEKDCTCEKCYECGCKVESEHGSDTCSCEPGPSVRTLRRVTTHVARKPDPKYRVSVGDTYKLTVEGGYYRNGPRWMTSTKRVTILAAKTEVQHAS